MSERLRMWSADRDGAVSGGPDGPMPVQRGDVVVVYVAKSWSDAAQAVKSLDLSGLYARSQGADK